MEAALDRFRAADTQVLGVSVDSVHSHANWGRDLGGVSFPLLSDFEPKGAVAGSFGHYLEEDGMTDRATVIVDKGGVVRYSVSVTPSGVRDVESLVAECERLNSEQKVQGRVLSATPIPEGTVLYVKSNCGPSRRALLAIDNLRLRERVEVRNVSDDPKAAEALRNVGGGDQAPCLVLEGQPIHEAITVVQHLANRTAPV